MNDLTTRYIEPRDEAACVAIFKACLAKRSDVKGFAESLVANMLDLSMRNRAFEEGYPTLVAVRDHNVLGYGSLMQYFGTTMENP